MLRYGLPWHAGDGAVSRLVRSIHVLRAARGKRAVKARGGRAGEDERTEGREGERGGERRASNIKRVCIRAKNRERRTAASSLRAVRAERAQNRRSADGSLPFPSRRVVRNKTIFPSTNLRLRDALRRTMALRAVSSRPITPSQRGSRLGDIPLSAACFFLLFFFPGSLSSSLRCF